MRNILLRVYDEAYDKIGAASWQSAWDFCHAAKVSLCETRLKELGREPYMVKICEILRHIENHEMVIYADADILFNPNATEIPRLFYEKPLMLSRDSLGVCCGFMVVHQTPQTHRLLETWARLGYSNKPGRNTGDQDTLKLLMANFNWVGELIGVIPEDVISNPERGPKVGLGSIGHHYWANGGRGYIAPLLNGEVPSWTGGQTTPSTSALDPS